MKIIFAGTPLNAAQTLEALVSAGIDVVAVLTRTDAAIGRKRVITPSPVAQVAERLGIPVFKHNQIDSAALADIKSVSADLGVVVAYGALLKEDALNGLPKGWINVHYSLLPKLRGAAPVQHAILGGHKTTGVTVFKLDQGMDTGPILSAVPTNIEVGENSAHLLSRLTLLGTSLLLELLPSIAAGFATEQKQDESLKTFAPKIIRSMAQIDWHKSALEIENLVNAMNPEPMAWTTLNDHEVRVLSARAIDVSEQDSEPGATAFTQGSVATKTGDKKLLELHMVQPAGKPAMKASDWLRGQESKGPVVFK